MKFILAENNKHILEEKYFLAEDTSLIEAPVSYTDIIIKWNKQITDSIPELTKIVESIKNNSNPSKKATNLDTFLNPINDAAKDVKQAQKLPDASDELRDNLNAYNKAVSAFVSWLEKNKSKEVDVKVNKIQFLKNDINQLNTLTSTSSWSTQDQNNALKIFNTLLDTVNDTFNTKNTTAQGATSAATDNLKRLCDDAIRNINKLPTVLLKDPTTVDDDTADSYIDLVKEKLAPSIKAILEKGELTKPLSYKAAEYQVYERLLTDFGNSVTALANLNVIKRQNSEKADWATLYRNCHTDLEFEAFWNRYFSEEWGKKGNFVKEFGLGFIEAAEKYGFSSITNPFIKFLKTLSIFKLIGNSFKKEAFIKIYNAVANGILKGSDLTAGDSSTFALNNIIFNENLYQITDFDKYLRLQNTLRERKGSLTGEAEKVYNAGQEGRGKVLNNLMLTSGSLENFNKDTAPGTQLRNETVIRQALEQITGSTIEDKLAATSQDLQAILDTVKSDTDAKELLAYLIDVLRIINQPVVNKADEKIGTGILYKMHDSMPRTTTEKMNTFDKLINRRSLDYTADQWTKLVLLLAEKAGIYKPKGAKII